ncbi:MAG: transglycosylase domain-containing protein [Prochlorothrix sp.]
MTSSPPTPPPPQKTVLEKAKTWLGQTGLGQTVMGQLVQTQLGRTLLQLRPEAKVPELEILNPEDLRPSVRRKLMGDRYALGRSSRCQFQIQNELVSGHHASLRRDPPTGGWLQGRPPYLLKDEQSTNGIYWGRRRVKGLELRHGDRVTLGPPELMKVVELRYWDPPSIWLRGLKYGIYGLGVAIVLAGAALVWEWRKVPVQVLGSVQGPIAAYSSDNQPLATLGSESHVELERLKDFSPYLPKAVIASEDTRFYWHFGFDPLRIVGAIVIRLGGGQLEGASTVTQQIARSLFPDYVGRDDSLGRKIREVIVATQLETFYSKDELLLTYLNRVYLGVGYGFEDAAQQYFLKSARDLTLSEAATLVGILPAPNGFSPCEDLETARGLRNRVVNRMLELNMVTEEEAQTALRSVISFDPAVCDTSGSLLFPYFYGRIIDELDALYGRSVTDDGNFIIETSLNLDLQALAETTLRETLRTQGNQYGFDQGAVVTLDAKTGSILALVGGFDYQESQFNRATQALRQPGSTFKVFAYAAALEAGISPRKGYSCDSLTWQGQFYSACERSSGTIDMYQALSQSENVVALRIAQDVGLGAVVEVAQAMGIRSDLLEAPGLVLGQSEVTLLELTGAYGVLANGGTFYRPHAIDRVYDSNTCTTPGDRRTCRVSYDAGETPGDRRQVLDPQTAQTMTTLLQGVVREGTGRSAGVVGAAGKTGTTNNAVDLWFVGYVPQTDWVTGVWLGNDDNRPTSGGSWLAAQLWGRYMNQALEP